MLFRSKESMDNADFRDEIERIAKQSLEEQQELNNDIKALEEGQVKAAEKYDIDLENQDDVDATIAYLQAELDGLRNLSQDESVYNRLRDEVAETRTKENKAQKQKEKDQDDYSNVPNDILDKLDAHAFAQKLGAKYTRIGNVDYFEQQQGNQDLANAVKSGNVNKVADSLLKSLKDRKSTRLNSSH